MTIATARKLPALGSAKMPCDIPGAGIHGCAWEIKKPDTWNKRAGVATHDKIMTATPKKSELSIADADNITKVIMHDMKMQAFTLCNHLKESGKDKILKWFGDNSFVDMCKDGILPPDATPRAKLEHLEAACAQPSHFCRLMEEVENLHDGAHSTKMTVKKHFMTLQTAREEAMLLINCSPTSRP